MDNKLFEVLTEVVNQDEQLERENVDTLEYWQVRMGLEPADLADFAHWRMLKISANAFRFGWTAQEALQVAIMSSVITGYALGTREEVPLT
jgi:hypothetical protein